MNPPRLKLASSGSESRRRHGGGLELAKKLSFAPGGLSRFKVLVRELAPGASAVPVSRDSGESQLQWATVDSDR